jgi:hypothetical protein
MTNLSMLLEHITVKAGWTRTHVKDWLTERKFRKLVEKQRDETRKDDHREGQV